MRIISLILILMAGLCSSNRFYEKKANEQNPKIDTTKPNKLSKVDSINKDEVNRNLGNFFKKLNTNKPLIDQH